MGSALDQLEAYPCSFAILISPIISVNFCVITKVACMLREITRFECHICKYEVLQFKIEVKPQTAWHDNVTRWGVWSKVHQTLYCNLCSTFKNLEQILTQSTIYGTRLLCRSPDTGQYCAAEIFLRPDNSQLGWHIPLRRDFRDHDNQSSSY